MIVLLGGEKGGTGKSTLAVNLAVWLSRKGRDVVVVDTDRQLTASRWVERRNALADASRVHCVAKYENVYQAVVDLSGRYEQVICDAGGRDSQELRSAMVAADLLYTPLKASQPDIETSVHMSRLVRLARGMNPDLLARLVVSMAPTHPSVMEARDAADVLADLPDLTLSAVRICERKVYRDAMSEGLGVVEMGNAKARDEIARLASEIYGGAIHE